MNLYIVKLSSANLSTNIYYYVLIIQIAKKSDNHNVGHDPEN